DFDQSNDYSFDASITTYTDNPQITVYYQGNLVWGTEPGIINPPPTINHPEDISYQEGETGNEIIWIATDNDPATYTITQNGVQVETGTWTSGSPITINVDGLLLGEAADYIITVSDQIGQTVTNTVSVSTISISLPELGDVNRDGLVDIIDALMIAQYYVGLDPEGFWEPTADVNNDGFIDIIDALMVAQIYVGLIELP
ncbi:MAG: dockerin type I repeat-containing protein, partial [Candidatus Lokiarchaeota archaeon]|nr:dockerin type I repeat-containing protein [Candidatus Lokiarchaeota archaeon]